MEASRATPPSSQCACSGHLELPQRGGGGSERRLPLNLCSRSWRICSWISLCCSSSCREPSSRRRSICRAGLGGVTILCRSNSRLAHLVKVPGRLHLQARAQQPVGWTDYPDPTEEGKGMPSAATKATEAHSPPFPADRFRLARLDAHLLLQCPGAPALLLLLTAMGLGLPLSGLQVWAQELNDPMSGLSSFYMATACPKSHAG